ncbi:MAG: prolyl aminopeptidase [Gammaproteobacteria bacterium]|nr:prolyl aminopeptidase [Gammaproteobacteria bacterium]
MRNYLYPDLHPYHQQFLQVDECHRLYIEESGNPDGIPVVFLHGGPGASCGPMHRRFFDPKKYRIILFDQRGCGQSIPHASLQDNTSQELVQDMERIRAALEIKQWIVFGGSWGSTLALLYAQAHPKSVLALVVRGIFLCRDEDVKWFYQQGTSALFPEYWQDFVAPIPESERGDMIKAYYKVLTGKDDVAKMRAAEAWSLWEGRTACLQANDVVIDYFSDPYVALSVARIEAHYFVNNSFLQPDQILNNTYKLKNIPGYIVHGRYDVICPAQQAWALHQAWPESQLNMIEDAGHAVSEPGITQRLVEIMDELAVTLS